jgi:uncharacterized protein YecT (DUF1311 family)
MGNFRLVSVTRPELISAVRWSETSNCGAKKVKGKFAGHRIWLIFGLCLLSNACFAQHMNAKDGPCQEPSTTAKGYDCFYAASKKADFELSTIYRRVQTVVNGQDLVRLREAQRLWMQFRDASCSAEYELYEGASGGPTAKVVFLEALTKHRAEELEVMCGCS